LDELARDREAEPGAAGLRAREGAPEALAHLRVDSGAVVAHAQPDAAPGEVLADGDLDARGGRLCRLERLARVCDEVDYATARRAGVAGELAGAVDLARDLDPRARGALAEARERRVDDVAEPQRRELRLLLAREAQEVRDRALDALELGERHARGLDVLRAARVLLPPLHQAP